MESFFPFRRCFPFRCFFCVQRITLESPPPFVAFFSRTTFHFHVWGNAFVGGDVPLSPFFATFSTERLPDSLLCARSSGVETSFGVHDAWFFPPNIIGCKLFLGGEGPPPLLTTSSGDLPHKFLGRQPFQRNVTFSPPSIESPPRWQDSIHPPRGPVA